MKFVNGGKFIDSDFKYFAVSGGVIVCSSVASVQCAIFIDFCWLS